MKKKFGVKVWALIDGLALVGVLIVNALANILPLNQKTTGELSDAIPNLFVPAGLTFSIWGIIYLLLLFQAFGLLYAAFSSKKDFGWKSFDGLLYFINLLANAAWIFVWHWQLLSLSLVCMLVILLSLIWLNERRWKESRQHKNSFRERLFFNWPIQVYLGWICVATIANITAVLVVNSWQGFGLDPQIWTCLVLCAGFVIAMGLLFRRNAFASVLVFLWAYLGIILKRASLDAEAFLPILVCASLLILLMILGLGLRFIQIRRSKI